jgi:hypothetical protein
MIVDLWLQLAEFAADRGEVAYRPLGAGMVVTEHHRRASKTYLCSSLLPPRA